MIERVARAIWRTIKALCLSLWHFYLPLMICVLGGFIWKDPTASAVGWPQVMAMFIWTSALSLVAVRFEAKTKTEIAKTLLDLMKSEKGLTLKSEITYRADDATLAAWRVSRDAALGEMDDRP